MNGTPHLHMTGYGAEETELILTGSYTEPGQTGGIRLYELNERSGELTPLFEGGCSINPSFLALHDGKIIAVDEVGQDSRLILYRWAGDEKRLLPEDQLPVPGMSLCHIHPWPGTAYFTVSGYSSGSFLLCRLECGRLYLEREIFPGNDYIEPEFGGKTSHVHSTLLSPDGRYLYVADLGLDRIFRYGAGPGGLTVLEGISPISFPCGEGPRHMVFSEDGRYLYVVTELKNHLFTFSIDEDGNAKEQQELPVQRRLPSKEEAAGADIKISGDGRFVYASDRGPDTITQFARSEENGGLRYIEEYHSGGHWPRNFCLSRSQRYLLAANERSGTLAVLARDPRTGSLSGPVSQVPAPHISFVTTM